MYSESDYSKFEKKVLERAKEIAEQRVKSARLYAQEKLIEAEKEGKRIFEEKRQAALIDIEAFKFNKIAEIDAEVRKKIENREIAIREELLNTLKEKLQERFPMMLGCFLTWIKNNYTTGKIITSPEFKNRVKEMVGEQFEIETDPSINGVIFKKERMVIEFSLESILEEFKGEIDKEIASILEV
ncbi:hypothetical protein [Desulfurobacterium atlanticum]|uniref:V/A-type H+-transporting ATPase subunit E n=1 Tax=Desulfurobacterium atlanticum TaxID=240169 RepID=A0A238XRB9_9BACT|nr:hypothetical protein [Desulfurobacterium atlanticum]SNR61497.1 hypothetical protein SAMN06265340_101202 [Desulfurobacterium atlanticum]